MKAEKIREKKGRNNKKKSGKNISLTRQKYWPKKDY